MKALRIYLILIVGVCMSIISSCKNQDIEFDNYDYSAVYFARQTPVRTLVMGEDTYDTSLDNEHKCQIYATISGVYSNTKKVEIGIEVDNSLCDNLYYDVNYTMPVKAMPADYYELSSDKIILDKEMMGAVDVKFTDKFFEDPDALTNTYVIPVRMTDVINADSILSGKTNDVGVSLTNASHWITLPMNYVLYCVKYINEWDGNYLRRGKDIIETGETTTENVRHKEYVEYDDICNIDTKNLTTAIMPVSLDEMGDYELTLSFNDKKECTVTTETEGFAIRNGNGKFVKDGDKNSWGNKDRDVIYLDYTILNESTGALCHTLDTLVIRDRGVSYETFSTYYKE